jgi:hypothetical protein
MNWNNEVAKKFPFRLYCKRGKKRAYCIYFEKEIDV